MKNAFGKVSSLRLTAGQYQGASYVKEASFCAPFKIMQPFAKQDGSICVMILSASAGIMEGDIQEIEIETEEYAALEVVSQSYEKIHKMKDGYASRTTNIKVGKHSCLHYHPLPTIPFAGSDFRSRTNIYLEDETSVFVMSETLSCGRAVAGECFEYKRYDSLTEIVCGGRLKYRDSIRYEPEKIMLTGFGMYEGRTHLTNLLFCNCGIDEQMQLRIRKDIECQKWLTGGITKQANGFCMIKMLGNSAQELEALCKKYVTWVKN